MRASLLGNQSNMSMVLLKQHLIILEEVFDAVEDILLNNRPVFLEEQCSESIKPRGFSRTKAREGLNYLCFRG